MNNPPTPSKAPPELERARIAHRKGNLDAAEPVYQQFTQTHPGLSDPWMLLGVIQIQRGNPAGAVEKFLEAIKRDFTNAFALGNLGGAYLQLQQFGKAEEALKKAIALDPGMIEAHFNLGTLYATISKTDKAIRQFDTVLMAKHDHLGALVNKGRALMDAGKYQESEIPLRKVLKLDPYNLKALFNLAQCMEKLNRLDEADDFAKILMEKHPEHPHAQIISGVIDYRQKRPQKACDTLTKVLSKVYRDLSFLKLAHFTLAKSLDDLERYDEAYAVFVKANEILLSEATEIKINPAVYRTLAADAREAQKNNPALPGPAALGGEPRQPVFFVGFPRSGTTLFEQMLAAHPDIFAVGEKSPLVPIEQAMFTDPQLPCSNGVVECLNKLDDTQLLVLRDAFWKNLELNVGAVGDKLLVDKMPLNIIHLPLAARLFPDAKVVMALRDPRDAVLSCFMQHFGSNDAMPNFTKLETTVELYDIVMGMWLELRDSLPLKWIEYKYEDLVTDMEGTISPVLDFIGVGWTDELNAYREKASNAKITTPSYTSVGEELYTRASGRWRNYQKHMDPVLETLTPYIKAFGYEET